MAEFGNQLANFLEVMPSALTVGACWVQNTPTIRGKRGVNEELLRERGLPAQEMPLLRSASIDRTGQLATTPDPAERPWTQRCPGAKGRSPPPTYRGTTLFRDQKLQGQKCVLSPALPV